MKPNSYDHAAAALGVSVRSVKGFVSSGELSPGRAGKRRIFTREQVWPFFRDHFPRPEDVSEPEWQEQFYRRWDALAALPQAAGLPELQVQLQALAQRVEELERISNFRSQISNPERAAA